MNALNSKVATSFAALVSDTIKLINRKLNLFQYQKMNHVNLNSYCWHIQIHHTDTKDAGKIPFLGLSKTPKETVVS